MYTILWCLLSTLCHRAVLQYVLPLRELPQCSFIQEDLTKIILFKILHAVCICIVMSTQSNLPFWTLCCGHLSGWTLFYYGHSFTNTLYYRRLSDTGTSPLRTIYYGHLFITDTSLLQTLSITDTHLVWSLLRTFSITDTCLMWNPLCYGLFYGNLFITDTSLLQVPINCRHLWYGHVFITDTSQCLLQTPINCRHLWYGHVFITNIAYYRHHPLIIDTSGIDMSLQRTPLIYTFLLRTLLWTPLWYRHLLIRDSSIIP